MQEALVGKLRSHLLHNTAKKKKRKRNQLFDLIGTHSLLLVSVTDFWSPHGLEAASRESTLCRLSITRQSGVYTEAWGKKKKKDAWRPQPGLGFSLLLTGHPGDGEV